MSTLGAGARSRRAPAMPSIVGRPSTGSKIPGCVTGPTTGAGFDQFEPPSDERDITSNASPEGGSVAMPNTYAVPLLSVRTVHPSAGFRSPLFAAGVTWCCVHVSPPSWETPTISGAGAAFGDSSWPRYDAQHRYTVPKNGLDAA